MGYESRLYVVNKSRSGADENKKIWSEVVAKFNLCKCGIDFSGFPASDCYFYEGNDEIVEDNYGDPLRELTISEAISVLATAMAKEDYRRFQPCLAMLTGFNQHEWENLVVLHFGY
jgi:hypothetical protein